jgi:hypothetical protein
MSEADAFLGGGAPGQKFPSPGFKWGGTVVSWEMAQQTDLDTGELKFWEDGKPRMQLIMTLQGAADGVVFEWDGSTHSYNKTVVEDDDGMRRLFIKAGLQQAVAKALRDARTKLEVGAYLEVTRGKDLPPPKKGYSGKHTFSAVWTPANKNPHAASALLAGDDEESPF